MRRLNHRVPTKFQNTTHKFRVIYIKKVFNKRLLSDIPENYIHSNFHHISFMYNHMTTYLIYKQRIYVAL